MRQESQPDQSRYVFGIDRGGTFTDIVGWSPDGTIVAKKVLSVQPGANEDAAIRGIREILGIGPDAPIPHERIAAVRMGTTVGTNALLERKGEPTIFIVTQGFGDAIRIGYQDRPRLFELNIKLPSQLYSDVIEVEERVGVNGEIIVPLNIEKTRQKLAEMFGRGFRCCAIAFIHSYRFPEHEKAVAKLAREVGFEQISVSHECSGLVKFVGRAETTIVDSYLTPILQRYIDGLDRVLGKTPLYFMQSNGGLSEASQFRGKDCVLSGPAGGIVGAVAVCAAAGLDKTIAFDMGGTSTDVTHYAGHYERTNDNAIAGVRIRSPMLKIVTVAAGGGSIINFEGTRLRVGPESAGSYPGPAAYRNGGPLTVTDCNIVLGRLPPEHFPKVFGANGDQPLDVEQSHRLFDEMAIKINAVTGSTKSKFHYAEEFLSIAVESMANAIKKVSTDRGYDVSKYTLCSFGGAGGQHACKVADALRINKIFVHPLAGVLSAYGMGLADVRAIETVTMELEFGDGAHRELDAGVARLADTATDKVVSQGVCRDHVSTACRAMVRYKGAVSSLEINFSHLSEIRANFEEKYKAHYGFALDRQAIVIESIAVEAFGPLHKGGGAHTLPTGPTGQAKPQSYADHYVAGSPARIPVYRLEDIGLDARIAGPAIVVEDLATTVIDDGWTAVMHRSGGLILTSDGTAKMRGAFDTAVDPYFLELFNNRFRSIAEQMGHVFANSAHSVNIKERLDFSCALFDRHRNLIANAPHIPIHFGAMSESVEAVFNNFGTTMVPGDVFALNSPFHGGAHLPDVTVVMPIFDKSGKKVLFYSSTRGHHADIGGITPGSLPPDSRSIHEEGALIEPMRLVHNGEFAYEEIKRVLTGARYPVRSFNQNVIDLQAQVASCVRGHTEIRAQLDEFGEDVVVAYGDHLLDMAEKELREIAHLIPEGTFTYAHDLGFVVSAAIRVDKVKRSITVDFSGSSPQVETNFNAPAAIARSATLYVFRTLIDRDIPLNSGFLRPIEFIIPENSFLNPKFPAAVSSGNAETSMLITDALFGALGILGASQGTMNNFTFGNDIYQYYETICGGASAGHGFDGATAVHTHMTNSRMTDPEILEMRFPVRVEEFSIRHGSGGKGRWNGGDGVKRRVRFLERLDMAIVSNRRVIPPYGARGANAASLGVNRIILANGEIVPLKSCDKYTMNPGDAFEVLTPGGGGYSV